MGDLEKLRKAAESEKPRNTYFIIFDENKDRYTSGIETLSKIKNKKVGKIFYFTCGEGDWIS